MKRYWPCYLMAALALWLERDLIVEAILTGQDPTKER